MFSSYNSDDVTILLKDITGLIKPQPTLEREKSIQSGTHYSEMLPIEYEPSDEYMRLFNTALEQYSGMTADAVGRLAQAIYADKGPSAVLVSLARAGTPIGILLKRYIKKKYGVDVPHYTISIIRGRGIDNNAMKFILDRHKPESIQFVDGWTGKGAITRQLGEAMLSYDKVSPGIAVLSDPAFISEKCGTHNDFLIPSSCLNSTVSGLLSRTVLRNDLIGATDFHGAVFYKELKDVDLSYKFIDTVESKFSFEDYPFTGSSYCNYRDAIDEINSICEDFAVSDINFVKPSIGETTRVLLRRVPWGVIVHATDDYEHLGHIYQLAHEKNVPLIVRKLEHYRACGIIKELGDV